MMPKFHGNDLTKSLAILSTKKAVPGTTFERLEALKYFFAAFTGAPSLLKLVAARRSDWAFSRLLGHSDSQLPASLLKASDPAPCAVVTGGTGVAVAGILRFDEPIKKILHLP